MRKRCERDIELFALKFFAHHLRRPFGRMHRELLRLQRRALWDGDIGQRPARRLALAAPRGAAKTTLKSLVFPLHATLYGRERYIVILSATLKQARQRLSNIQGELQANTALAEFYPAECARRGRWTRSGLVVNGVAIEVYSAGTEIRGISHGPWRPSLIILDDIENSRAVASPARRDELAAWFAEVVENLGDSYTAIEIVGTLLHPDSLLARLLRRPDFETRVFRSIEAFAEREDLWEQWRRLYTDLADPDREARARRFFNRHRAEMLRGTRVLWNAREDYYELMRQLVTKGRPAFFKEKQNEPGAGGEGYFDLARLHRFRLQDGLLRPSDPEDAP